MREGHPHPRTLAAIAIGGGIGSVARYGDSYGWRPRSGRVPSSTLAVNLVGSLLLGMLEVAVTEIWRPHPLLRPALVPGLLGGFTTFSTLAVEAVELAQQNRSTAALSYALLSLSLGIGAAALGYALV
ncbi:MAG: fluoride exporter [Pseudonocardiales bacterium]|nr:fluoride exporter [Pseudonocardiales bacterium]